MESGISEKAVNNRKCLPSRPAIAGEVPPSLGNG
jgi:hypothetical protein